MWEVPLHFLLLDMLFGTLFLEAMPPEPAGCSWQRGLWAVTRAPGRSPASPHFLQAILFKKLNNNLYAVEYANFKGQLAQVDKCRHCITFLASQKTPSPTEGLVPLPTWSSPAPTRRNHFFGLSHRNHPLAFPDLGPSLLLIPVLEDSPICQSPS